MNKTTSLAGVIALMTACVPPALAQNFGDYGLYVAGGLSRINASFDNARGRSVDESDTTGSLRVGYMFPNRRQLNGLFGLELGYLDLGSFKSGTVGRDNEVDVSADGFTIAGVASFRAAQSVDIYARLGAYMVDTTSSSVVNGQRVSSDDGGTEPFFALGAEIDNGDWNFFGEFAKVDAGGRNFEADVITVGVKFEFRPVQ